MKVVGMFVDRIFEIDSPIQTNTSRYGTFQFASNVTCPECGVRCANYTRRLKDEGWSVAYLGCPMCSEGVWLA